MQGANGIEVTRRGVKFVSDDRRVIARRFHPGSVARVKRIVERIMTLDDTQVIRQLEQVKQSFAIRHKQIAAVWQEHYDAIAGHLVPTLDLSVERQLLTGAYFTMEYSFESAALFNPSIVPHHNQEGVPDGAVRFLMSLRATGEGHVSSIVFRTGVVTADGDIEFDPTSPFARSLQPVRDAEYDRQTFFHKLIETGGYTTLAGDVLDRLDASFTLADLQGAIERVRQTVVDDEAFTAASNNLLSLARSNYMLQLPPGCDPSEVVIFPVSKQESKGMEDMRLVRFTDDDGTIRYYGTYTAFNGARIFPQLIETPAFDTISVTTMSGRFAQNKGHALFPRKIDEWYMMSSRIDGENLYIMRSRNIRFWNEAQMLDLPKRPWEFVQVGNCGSPLETERGWLLLMHGVGPMRQYCIGASLLDLNDPTRVIGHLREPMLIPNDEERNGYVPNVVYSCGGMIHGDLLVMPYAMSDSASSVATVPLEPLLDALCAS